MQGQLEAARSTGWRVRCDLTEGACFVDGADASLEPIVGWTDTGASLRILNADTETRAALSRQRSATSATVRGLVARLTQAFDPAGVLQ